MTLIEQFENGSIVLLLFFLAVVPAVGEEFVFRGIIGRGLTARWGLCWGVLITSCLFALMHAFPPHILAVLPIGIMMHIIYLATRSFWAPVLFHFSNNAMAAIFLALGVVTDEELTWWMPLAALPYLAFSVFLLYHYRTRYVNDEDQEIGPGYLTVEEPPPEAGARRFARTGWIVAPLVALVLAGTVFYIASDVANSLNAPPEAGEPEAAELDVDPGVRPQQIEVTGLRNLDLDHEAASSPHFSSDCRIKA